MKHADLVMNKGAFAELNSNDRLVTDYKRIKTLIEHCKGLGLKIVLTQGTFDMIHVGHGRYLKHAKNQGDILIVGIDSDQKVKHRKGPERPIVPETERVEMLTHLRYVDLVFVKQLKDPKWSLIKAIRPDILIATKQTYNTKQLKELKQYCGNVIVMEPMATTSTTARLRLLQLNTAKKFGQNLTPKIFKAIEDVLTEARG